MRSVIGKLVSTWLRRGASEGESKHSGDGTGESTQQAEDAQLRTAGPLYAVVRWAPGHQPGNEDK